MALPIVPYRSPTNIFSREDLSPPVKVTLSDPVNQTYNKRKDDPLLSPLGARPPRSVSVIASADLKNELKSTLDLFCEKLSEFFISLINVIICPTIIFSTVYSVFVNKKNTQEDSDLILY